VLWVWTEGLKLAGTFCKLVYDPLVATDASPLTSAAVREIAPLRPATLWTGAAAAAAAVNETTSLVEWVWAAGLKVAGTFDRAVYEIAGLRAMANVPAVTSLACSCTAPTRPATDWTGARLATAAVLYDAIWNCPALVEIVMPSPEVSWNVPKALVAVPGATTKPAGPMPPLTVTGTDALTLPTVMATAVPPDTLTPAAVLETTTWMLMGRKPSACPTGKS
jgi:hypothetical protein